MTTEMILGFVRHLLTIMGGVMVSKGLLTTGMADTLVGSVLSVAGVIWSLVQKKQQADAEARALLTPTLPVVPGSKITGALSLAFALLLLPALALGAGPSERQKQIASPYSNPDALPTIVGSFYATALLQSSTDFSSDEWAGGLAIGYVLKAQEKWVFGVEADAARRFTNFEEERELDQWLFSLRGRAGYLFAPSVLAFGTAGAGFRSEEVAFVWGGGVEVGLWEQTSLRGEVLRFEFDDQQTVFRLGLTRRF